MSRGIRDTIFFAPRGIDLWKILIQPLCGLWDDNRITGGGVINKGVVDTYRRSLTSRTKARERR